MEAKPSTPLPKICVVVRKRPINKKELLSKDSDIVKRRSSKGIIIKGLKKKFDCTMRLYEDYFTFDCVFDEMVDNKSLYRNVVRPLVYAAFEGIKVTCFAHGQTGSGKTYTMLGSPNKEIGATQVPGLFLLAGTDIFQLRESSNIKLGIWVSFYEIYCGKLFDLLNNRTMLFAREDGKQVSNQQTNINIY